MPLTRAQATPAEHITLPFYPIAYLLLGTLFLAQPEERTRGSAFDVARAIGDPVPGIDGITVWGLVFLIVGTVEATALLANVSHRFYVWALIIGTGLATFWTVALFASAIASDDVSFTAVVWVLFAPVLQAASAAGLARHSRPSEATA